MVVKMQVPVLAGNTIQCEILEPSPWQNECGTGLPNLMVFIIYIFIGFRVAKFLGSLILEVLMYKF